MNTKIEIQNPSEIRKKGITVLLNELGPRGMVEFLGQFDNGGSGDYTMEKYEMPDITLDEILKQVNILRNK